jgi:hypothetical protein
MSKERELTSNELDAVSGGVAAEGGSTLSHAFWGRTPPSFPANAAAMEAWNNLLHQYGF